MFKKLVITILGLGVIAGVGFLAVNNSKKTVEEGDAKIVIPTKPVVTPANNYEEFSRPITLKLNQKITFPDGLVVILTDINDSRCPKDVQCIWAGEISVVLELSGGKLSRPGEVRLGTVMTESVNVEDYTINLKNADEKSVTIVVEYKKS